MPQVFGNLWMLIVWRGLGFHSSQEVPQCEGGSISAVTNHLDAGFDLL